MTEERGFGRHLSQSAQASLLTGLSLGLVMVALMGLGLAVRGEITLTLDYSGSDALWMLIGFPAFLCLLAILLSPLSYLILVGVRRLSGRGSADSDAEG